MRKIDLRNMLVWLAAFGILLADLAAVTVTMNSLNIPIYLLAVGLGPAVVLLSASLIYASGAETSDLAKYISAIGAAGVFVIVLMLYSKMTFTDAFISRLVRNTMAEAGAAISMSEAGAGDTARSALLYAALSCVGCFVGTRIYKMPPKAPAQAELEP